VPQPGQVKVRSGWGLGEGGIPKQPASFSKSEELGNDLMT
jgi:hypothetical protein